MRRRIAIVEKEKCHPMQCPGTWYCIKVCPINRMGKECKTKGADGKVQIDETLSSDACRICAHACPFGAIHIINLPEKLNEDPIFRYGENAFELFRLPKMKENEIVGILGRNGIGKSTALNILTGNITPNFGDYKYIPGPDQIIEKYAKTYLGDYFKKLYNGRIKLAYKPQKISDIPKVFSGTVKDVIDKFDEKNTGNDLLKDLDISHLKSREVSKLSGGELQRLAVAATLMKKADVYYFDEPASFLDVTSRIKVAKLIRGIKNASVMVVEHDLATLDYVSDEIQIIYGEQACYGIISQSKGVSRGINEYLDGFLPDENIRFRNYKIAFRKPIIENYKKEVLSSLPSLTKSFDSFKLNINPAVINRSEVMAVMGPNGLGKSTFLKLLAGEIHPDSGQIERLKIAYKPQYLEAHDELVDDFLKRSAGDEYETGWYKTNILEKLNIKALLQSNLLHLSGGELQKVFIGACLSSDAEVLALDEPSAFIDVEDRLKVAEVIKEFTHKKKVAAIVVDHDVQFIDYLADTMLVFEGIPGKEGHVFGPVKKEEGMNRVLKFLSITYRKDKETNRPRINKPDSQLDKEQRSSGKFYYV
ncbi:MAG TPA: ribosome biogenesis/translation initiation ATPase RLI [Candidatus Nanoarchaeia archaeon]|nr:ribosome biogenesis/translation initiation ATPase RLI [Candidatus Nanoarchaeia archaeon]